MARRVSGTLGSVFSLLSLAGCATNPAPLGFLPTPAQLARSARGAWIELAVPRPHAVTQGELIAVGDGQVHVLTRSGLRSIRLSDVRRAKLVLHDPERVGAGGLLSLTHGLWLPFTVIPWLALGEGAQRAPVVRPRPQDLESFAKYARFPQGLPPRLTPEVLGPLMPGHSAR